MHSLLVKEYESLLSSLEMMFMMKREAMDTLYRAQKIIDHIINEEEKEIIKMDFDDNVEMQIARLCEKYNISEI
jgi:hypothetical protein